MFTDYDDWDDDDSSEYEDENRYIKREDARPNNQYHLQETACPECGSYNTGSSTYTDYCNTCGWVQGY
jgi:uncharacterized OB-fold protein